LSLAQLSDEDKAYIQTFQSTIEIALEMGKKATLAFMDLLILTMIIFSLIPPQETLKQLLWCFDALLLTGGHTHTQHCADWVMPGIQSRKRWPGL